MSARAAVVAAMVALLLLLASLAACASGPVSGPVVAGAAAVLAVLDQLLAGGVIDPGQHAQLAAGIQAMQGTITAAEQGVAAVKAAQAGAINTTELVTSLGATAVAVAGGLNAYRNKTRQKAMVKAGPVKAGPT